MRDLNKIIVSGRAVKDAEYKEVNETKIEIFTLANNNDDKVNYFPVTCYGGLAENVVKEYVTKGKALQIEGRLKQESFQNKEGVFCSKLTIIAERINLQGTGKTEPEKSKTKTKKNLGYLNFK